MGEPSLFDLILNGTVPSHKVAEGEDWYAFLDIFPRREGHTLVIPKSAAENIHEIDPEVLSHTVRTTQVVSNAVKQAFDAPGIMIAQLNGAAAGQTVFHLHFHILPRFQGLEFSLHAREMQEMDVLQDHAERIKTFL